MCSYKNNYEIYKEPTNSELDEIYESLLKFNHEEKTINCGSCGYNTCEDMAKMIHYGYNVRNNCVHYMKTVLLKQLKIQHIRIQPDIMYIIHIF